jgi:hypothetical protein
MVKLAIAAANNSSARCPDSLTVHHLKYLDPRGLQFLARIPVFTASIPFIWKNSLIIPILKPDKPGNQGSPY